MERVCRPCMSTAEKAEVWRRWKRGESVSDIGRALGRFRKSVHRVVAAHGGVPRSGRPGSLLTLAPHRSGRAGSAASGSSTDSFATRRRVPAGPGSQAMATAIPKACLASSAIRFHSAIASKNRASRSWRTTNERFSIDEQDLSKA